MSDPHPIERGGSLNPIYVSISQTADQTTTGTVTAGHLKDTSLTATRVPFAGTGGQLADDADLTFATDTLTATKLVATTSIAQGAAGSIAPGTGGVVGTGAMAVEATGALTLGGAAGSTSVAVGQATVAPSFPGGLTVAASKAVTGAGALAVEATGALTLAGAAGTTSSLIGRAANLTTMVGNTRFAGDLQVNLADAGAAATSGTASAYAGTFTVSAGSATYVLTNTKIATTSLLFCTCISGVVAASVLSFIPTANTGTLLLSGVAGANAKFAFLVLNAGA